MNMGVDVASPVVNYPRQVDGLALHSVNNAQEQAKGYFIKFGIAVGAGVQALGVGGRLLGHGVAFYTYSQYAPTTLFGQYFYANAAHEVAMQVLNYSIAGVSVSIIATTCFSVFSGVVVAKIGVGFYNLFAEQEKKISLSIIGMIKAILFRLFNGLVA